ncbi:MAG: hypothetical protein E7520_02100 [Ruminococcaceae bacterium]|nr:hypothetical protein [Oscillospiraceae bacterium]
MFGVINILIIPTIIVLPIIIAFIYKYFYNKHINSGTGKKWISPLAVGLISFLVLTIVAITSVSVAFVAYKANPEYAMEIDTSQNTSVTLTEEEFNDSAFTAFNGRGVSGYNLENKRQKDFDYQLYSKVNGGPVSMPDYVVIITYTGSEEYNSAFAENGIREKTGGSSEGVSVEKSEKYYAIIDGTNIAFKDRDGKEIEVKHKLSYSLKLCSETNAEPMINGEAVPVATFEIELN